MGGDRQLVLEVTHEAAAVAQAGEGVGASLFSVRVRMRWLS